jgi:PAS domain S-box-containing protein
MAEDLNGNRPWTGSGNSILFSDIFDVEEIQRLQDLFADATGVASVITQPDGTPITKPSNFNPLFRHLISKTGKDRAKWKYFVAGIEKDFFPSEAKESQEPLDLMDASVSINAGGKHLANWLIGQVRSKTMLPEQFKKISLLLSEQANRLAEKGNNNLQLKCSLQDVTGSKSSQKNAEDGELRYRTLFETSPSGILVLDQSGIILEANEASTKTTLYTRNELIGSSISIIGLPEDRARISDNIRRILAGEILEHEVVNRRKDGTCCTFLLKEAAITLPDGQQGILAVSSDITERKLTEKALREREVKFRAIYEAANDAIFILKGNVFIDINPKTEIIFQLKKEDIIGHTVLELSPPEQPDGQLSSLKATEKIDAALTGDPQFFEWCHLRSNGTTFMTEVSLSKLEINGVALLQAIVRDISDRKQVEEALTIEQHLMETLMNNLPDYIYFKDAESRFIRINKSQQQLFHLKDAAEAVGKSDFDFFSEEHALDAYVDEQEIVRTGKPLTKEERETWTNRPDTWVLTTKMPLRDKSGNIIGTFGISKDITDRKLKEEALRQSQAFLNSIIEHSPYALWISDDSGTMIQMNQACRDSLKSGGKEVIGKYNIFRDSLLESQGFMPLIKDVFKKGTFARFVTSYDAEITKGLNPVPSAKVYLDLSISPIKGLDGKVTNAIIQYIDISDRIKAEEVLAASEAKFREIINVSPVPIALYDDQQHVTFLNPAFIQTFGYKLKDIPTLTRCWIKMLPDPEYRQGMDITWRKRLEQARQTGDNFTPIEVVLRCKNGTSKIVMASETSFSSPLINIHLIVLYDITLRKQTETEILKLNETLEKRVAERTSELENINREMTFHLREIEQFTYITSHDLQEPLRSLINFSQLLQEEYAGKLEGDGITYVDFISKSAGRMRDLVKGLLDYSLLGKESEMTTVDCNLIITHILSDITESIRANDAVITVQKLPELNAYETELRLLFQNLITNAIKFHKKGIPPEINISASSQQNEWIFKVEDNGIGIEEDSKESIFIIFKRMHNRNEYEGTGIGLSHCKKIVELHGGKIWVESTPGVGSSFIFTIPK